VGATGTNHVSISAKNMEESARFYAASARARPKDLTEAGR
jgi:catechol 2,3-dioxygenase-like lactoylglutathione lyase family enzyme